MSLVPHLVRADVRRFRPALMIWCVIVATAALLHGVHPAFADRERVSQLITLLAIVVWIGGLLVMLGLTGQVVQTHPLVGTNAFWMTRPIPPLSLLGAKVVFAVAAIVLVPVVAEMILMAGHGVALATMTAVAIQAAVVQLFWIVIATSFAALTLGLAQFFLLCGATPVALVLGLLFLEFVVAALGDRSWLMPSAFEHPRAGAVFVVLTIVAAAGLLSMLYRTRSRPRAIATGIALMVIALVLPELVPRPPTVNAVPEWAARLPPLTADVDSFRLERSNVNDEAEVLRGRVFASGLPPAWSATFAIKNDASLSTDSTSVSSGVARGFPESLSAPAVWEPGARESSTAAALKRVLEVDVIRGLPSDSTESARLLETNTRRLAGLAGKTSRYRATLTVTLIERSTAAVLPLERGASFTDGSRRTSIVAVRAPHRQDPSLSLTVREWLATTVLEPNRSGRSKPTCETLRGTRPSTAQSRFSDMAVRTSLLRC